MSPTKQILALNRFEASEGATLAPELAARVAKRQATFGASRAITRSQLPLGIMPRWTGFEKSMHAR